MLGACGAGGGLFIIKHTKSFIHQYVLPSGTHIIRSFMTELGASTPFWGVKFILIGPSGAQSTRCELTQPYWGKVSGRHLLLLLFS